MAALVADEPRCIYCQNLPTTVEHMPPISMFRARSRPSGLEFAACKECNSGTGGADVVAAFFARISQVDNPSMLAEAMLLRERLIKFAPGVFEEFQQPGNARKTWQRTELGILKPMAVIKITGPLTAAYLTAFSAKLGMALYREHVGVALPLEGGVQIQCFLNAGLARRTADGILKVLPGHETLRQGSFMVPEQFAYRYNCDEKSIVAALVGFNSNLHILVVATSQPELYKFPVRARHFHFVRPGELTRIIPRGAAQLSSL